MLVGYLVVGSVIGRGGLGLVADTTHELEMIAEVGALLLLFSVGIEFSFEELSKLSRYFLIGGTIQMLLVAIPLAVAARLAGLPTQGAILAGLAGSFSSTVLVFRALAEEGQLQSPHGRRGIAVLLFQDAALVPLLLLVPLVVGTQESLSVRDVVQLLFTALTYLAGVFLLHQLLNRFVVPVVASLRSVELIVLLTVTLLVGLCWTAHRLGLPPAIGAFATGLALSGNRLSKQIDTILLPFRETFASVFFVTLGMLLRPRVFLSEPGLLGAGLVLMIALKSLGGAAALRVVGLPWRAALGMGLGLSQLGEFSFLLVSRGVKEGIVDTDNYNRMLFIAVATLILTPLMLRRGLLLAGQVPSEGEVVFGRRAKSGQPRALVVGIGPIGGQIASRLETMGVDLAMIDLSSINLYPFAQMGFATYAGDARDPQVLQRVGVAERNLAVVCVPKDDLALEVVRSLRQVNDQIAIIVRCRYQAFARRLIKAGAMSVVSEEAEAAGPLMQRCDAWLAQQLSSPSTTPRTASPQREKPAPPSEPPSC